MSENGRLKVRDVRERECPFAIVRTELTNYRAFEHLDQAWQPFNVLVGANGSGKSTILDAVALRLRDLAAEELGDKSWVLPKLGDLRNGADEMKVRLSVRLGHGDDQLHTWARVLQRPILMHPDLPAWDQHGLDAPIGVSQPRTDHARPSKTPTVFYRPTRDVEVSPWQSDSKVSAQGEAPSNRVVGDFADFYRWFRDREDIENEAALRGDLPGVGSDPVLVSVRAAIERMSGYRQVQVRRQERSVFVKRSDDSWTDVRQLSHGERAMMLIAGDIARRLAISAQPGQDPLQGPGCVLIDELEMHLHPAWQRKALQGLYDTFPHVQFFITTHSPIVAGAAPKGSLHILRDGKVEQVEDAYGMDLSVLLPEVFDVTERPPEVEAQIDELARLIEEAPAEAGVMFGQLRAILGPTDPALVRAEMRLRLKGVR